MPFEIRRSIKKWQTSEIDNFIKYFSKQWLEGPFSSWSIYLTPAGLASTNNPIESFNGIIKKCFTFRFIRSLKETLETFEHNLVNYDHKVFKNNPKVIKESIKRGTELAKLRSVYLKQKKNVLNILEKKNRLNGCSFGCF